MDNAYPEHAIEGVPSDDADDLEDETELAEELPVDLAEESADGEDEGNIAENPEQSAEHQAKASQDLEELVRYVASKLVHSDEDIVVASEFRGGTVYVSLKVPEEEMGRVIGREGRTAKAIRTLVSIAGTRHNVHARLDIDG